MAEKEMSFWEHADELRGVLLRMAATVLLAATALFCLMPRIFDRIILWPCRSDFPVYRLFQQIARWVDSNAGADGVTREISLINTRLASQFMIHLSTSVELALVATFPMLIIYLWRFVAPGLYSNEKEGATRLFAMVCTLFYTGIIAGYALVFPLTLSFLANYQLSAAITNTITIDSYVDTFTGLLLTMGIVFEMPAVAWFLGKAGVIDRRFFGRWRRHAVVVLLIVAAVITPTSDPVTLAVVFVPLYLLWELSAQAVGKKEKSLELDKL